MSNLTVQEQKARSIVANIQPNLKVLLGDNAKVSEYSTTLQQLALNKNLQNVDMESVVKCGFEIVRAGLNPNPIFGQAYVVPFGKQAQLQIGYKGWIALGYRYGWKFRAVAVYNCDEFSVEFGGLSDKYIFNPNWDAREDDDGNWVFKNLKGVIVYAIDSQGNEFSEFVGFKKLEKLRQKSQNQKANNLSYIWLDWAEEMYRAKALKYVITRLPIQEEIINATVIENTDEVKEFEEPKPQITNNPFVEADVIDEVRTIEDIKKDMTEARQNKDTEKYNQLMEELKNANAQTK